MSLYTLVAVGWLSATLWLTHGPATGGVGMASPSLLEGILAADPCGPDGGRTHLGWASIWTATCGVAAISLLAGALLTSNRHVGRVEEGLIRRPRVAAKPGLIEEFIDEEIASAG